MTFRDRIQELGLEVSMFDAFAQVEPDYPVSPGGHMGTITSACGQALDQAESWEDAEARLSQVSDDDLLVQIGEIMHSSDGFSGWPWQYVHAIGHAAHVRLKEQEQ